jgi:Xaa-Pro dipeptidase
MGGWFKEEGLLTDALPVVASMENAGNPHYLPAATGSRRIGTNELVLLDLWGKLATAGAVYADITWVGFTGAQVPDEFARAFDAIARARDAAVDLVKRSVREGADLRGWQVDRAAREVLLASGFGAHVLHRTGHSLGTDVHGNGVHMDDYETHDDRRLIPGTGFTIEPGVYLPEFGIRSEINVVVGTRTAEPTGPCQRQIVQFFPRATI